jgi:hypothetical protein
MTNTPHLELQTTENKYTTLGNSSLCEAEQNLRRKYQYLEYSFYFEDSSLF